MNLTLLQEKIQHDAAQLDIAPFWLELMAFVGPIIALLAWIGMVCAVASTLQSCWNAIQSWSGE